jgi:hypothetical protein
VGLDIRDHRGKPRKQGAGMKFMRRCLLIAASTGPDVGAAFVREFIFRTAFRPRKPWERDGQA